MKYSKTPKRLFLSVFLLTLFSHPVPVAAEPARQNAVVEAVLSGDTVRLKGGKEFRYAGLQAWPTKSAVPLIREYGEAALAFNRSLVEGKTIAIEWGPQLRDKNNRLIGYAFLPDGTFVNREILKNGHAEARIVAPNLRYAEEFRSDEVGAKRAKKGRWLKEPPDPRVSAEIWGDKVSKTYYYPNSPELDDVPEAQKVRFRSRVEAKSKGYTPCFSCRHRADAEAAEET